MTVPDADRPDSRPFSCLVLEDNGAFASMVAHVVRELGGSPVVCGSLAEAGRVTAEQRFDLLLLDNHLPDGKVYDAFPRLSRLNPDAPAIMITGQADLGEAIDLTRNGLFEYLSKPVDIALLEACLRRALARIQHRDPGPDSDLGIGESPALREVRQLLREVARHPDATVLVTGESGVGKDVAVRTLHAWTYGDRAGTAPYVPVNCAAIPADMFEAELFGAERGAYTGADRRRAGLVGSAQGGTLFLDEIGEVPLPLQAKLLRFLESREYRALGGASTESFSGRVVAATNRSLRAEVDAGRFREDLLFRIEVFSITLPPLRERREDLPPLTERILAQLARKYRRTPPLLRESDLRILSEHGFPGNIRELRNILERSLLRTPPEARWLLLETSGIRPHRPATVPAPAPAPAPGAAAAPGSPPPPATSPESPLPPERADLAPLEAQEYRLIRTTLAESNGGIRRTAARLGISPQALLRRLEKWPELRPRSGDA